ncbi:MAG TPA: hypothetical protein VMM58_07060 [Bacteroidota bacterium]|nr:hypothetical protein [Bacteroidota bacterium]
MSDLSPHNGQQSRFPRSLTPFESRSLFWLLPTDRAGYASYRKYLAEWNVAGEGRRGAGNFILAAPGVVPDVESPLPQVFAYGVIEGKRANISVTLRELFEDQLEYEIVNLEGETIPADFSEKRRWSFSYWSPSLPCPSCGTAPREVRIARESGESATLAVCRKDKKVWIFDAHDGVNHLIPVTNFHNALMLHKNIRDPQVALAAENLFAYLDSYSDVDLTAALVNYNKLRKKIDLGPVVIARQQRNSIVRRMLSLFRK